MQMNYIGRSKLPGANVIKLIWGNLENIVIILFLVEMDSSKTLIPQNNAELKNEIERLNKCLSAKEDLEKNQMEAVS